jgi:uncharacterized protein YbaA (DUF1428 family)
MTKGKYVDGFVIVAPKNKIAAYKKMAQLGAKIWKKYGALDYKECVGDDMTPNMGGMPALTFPKMGKAKRNEVVWFSFIVYKNKKHRDQVNAKVMKDPVMNDPQWQEKNTMPFDMKKFAYGGFKVIVD